MLLVLHGARKNAGDYLIRDRGVALIEARRPGSTIELRPRWEPIDPDIAAAADAIVLCGGPGLTTHFYPATFPLVPDLQRLDIPVLPLALGWSGHPPGEPSSFRFDRSSAQALSTIGTRIGWFSVRDDLSLRILQAAGVETRRTGCVAWYHLPSIGRPLHRPSQVRHVVVSPPANPRLLREAASMLRLVAQHFPDAVRTCAFHRGIRHDPETRRPHAAVNQALAAVARHSGYDVVDASYGRQSLAGYGETDLHVGYRVHAHLDALSQRRPSLLVCEDGRGIGQVLTLGGPLIRSGQHDTIRRLKLAISEEIDSGFASCQQAVAEIDRTLPVMQAAIDQLAVVT